MDLASFKYLNYKGELEVRRVRPISIWFGSTAWHPEPQWFMEAFDLDRLATRDFSLSGILGEWKNGREAGRPL